MTHRVVQLDVCRPTYDRTDLPYTVCIRDYHFVFFTARFLISGLINFLWRSKNDFRNFMAQYLKNIVQYSQYYYECFAQNDLLFWPICILNVMKTQFGREKFPSWPNLNVSGNPLRRASPAQKYLGGQQLRGPRKMLGGGGLRGGTRFSLSGGRLPTVLFLR